MCAFRLFVKAVPSAPALFVVGFVACVGCLAQGVEPDEGYEQKSKDARRDGTKDDDDFYDDDWTDSVGGSDNTSDSDASANGGMPSEGGMGGDTQNTGGTGGQDDPWEGTGGSTASAGASGSDTGGSSGTSGASGAGGASGFGGSSGAGGSSGSGGSGGGSVCNQQDNEPNNTEATCQHLGEITDQDANGSGVTGTLKNASDKDWFSLHVLDTAGFIFNPTWKVESANPIDVCVYVVCDKGTTTITCNSPATASTSPGGKSGCCAKLSDGGVLTQKLNCTGTNNETSMSYVSVSSSDTPLCAKYRLIYHY